eukprot:g5838.t1
MKLILLLSIPDDRQDDRQKVLDTIGELFKENYKHIMYTFEFYSAMGNSSDLSQMLFNQCMDMLGDMEIPEDNKYINKGALDRLFVEANVEDPSSPTRRPTPRGCKTLC